MNLEEFSKNSAQLLEADPHIWSLAKGSERILVMTSDLYEGVKIDAVSKSLEFPVSLREGRFNCILTFSQESFSRFCEKQSLSYLHSISQLHYEGNVDDVFRGSFFLEKIVNEMKNVNRGVHLH